MVDHIVKEALAARDLAGLRSVSDFSDKIDRYASIDYLQLSGGWRLEFDYRHFMGFALFNDEYKLEIPHGIPCCPVKRCPDVIYGGHHCGHLPLRMDRPKHALFPNDIFTEKEFKRLHSVICTHFNKRNFWRSANDAEESAIDRLGETKGFYSDDHNVMVVRVDGTNAVRITLNDTGSQLFSCSKRGCYRQGIFGIPSNPTCMAHKQDCKPPAKASNYGTRDNLKETLKTAWANATRGMKEHQVDKPDLRLKRFITFMHAKGEKGFKMEHSSGDIYLKLTEDFQFYYQSTARKNRMYKCIAEQCAGPAYKIVGTNRFSLFCVKHRSFKKYIDKDEIREVAMYGSNEQSKPVLAARKKYQQR